jgi:hypothetical protein
MSEGIVPAPDFDSSRYERPNKSWVCGHACEGCPCRIGPSPSGKCRATTECAPRLVLRPGEAKGAWLCTRPADWGGPCEAGPLPDGTCCRAIPPCRPVRSLRARRGLLTRAVVAACVGCLLLGLSGSVRESFINPRPLSRQHSEAKFARLAARPGNGQGCVFCHADAKGDIGTLVAGALAASRSSLRFAVLASSHPRDFSRMDRSCVACHQGQSFHEADVAVDTSCSTCHREHLGSGPMAAVAEENCVDCHGDARQMLAAREKSRRLPAAAFSRRISPGAAVHAVLRPVDGFTEVITSFAVDHPEFRVLREKSTDANTLKFNHRLHLTGSDIPPVNGRQLDCAYCHTPDASGAFKGRISFETSCRACHALDFDVRNPGMTLPHGDAAFVRAYLRSLPVQYADFASRKLGLTGRREIDAFVQRQMKSLRERMSTGEDLERTVFLSDGRSEPVSGTAGESGSARARFSGCATCHEVSWRENAIPVVTPPQAPDRWLPGAAFDHALHASMTCSECHAAARSERASDIILPTRQSCARCHSPQGGAAFSCISCHVYHNPPPSPQPAGVLTASMP